MWVTARHRQQADLEHELSRELGELFSEAVKVFEEFGDEQYRPVADALTEATQGVGTLHSRRLSFLPFRLGSLPEPYYLSGPLGGRYLLATAQLPASPQMHAFRSRLSRIEVREHRLVAIHASPK